MSKKKTNNVKLGDLNSQKSVDSNKDEEDEDAESELSHGPFTVVSSGVRWGKERLI